MAEYAMVGLQVGSSILGGIAATQQGNAAGAQGEWNAQYFEGMAGSARARGRVNADRVRREGEQVRSRIVQAIGSSGVVANDGSGAELDQAQASEYEWRRLLTEWEGEVEATNYLHQAAVARWQGRMAAQSAYGQAAGSLLKGFGALANSGIGDWFGGGGGGGGATGPNTASARGGGMPSVT